MKIKIELSYQEELTLMKASVVIGVFILFFMVGLMASVKAGLILGLVMAAFFLMRVLMW